jgi:glucose/arabinose dehydrogenase
MQRPIPLLLATLVAVALTGCGETARLAVSDGTGATPKLPEPNKSLIPTLNVAKAVGWPAGGKPTGASGTTVNAFAAGLDHPRWLYTLPNGDVLVAESNAPPKPDDGKGIRGFVQKIYMKNAGAGTPSANRITLLRDAEGDGVAEVRDVFIKDLHSPFGMVLVGNDLYVADTDAVLKFAYTPGATHLDGPGTKLVDLPAGTINHHWTKNIIASADGSKLYVSVGSNSNVGDNGEEAEVGRAAIWEVDTKTGDHRVFASGLRNPVGMAWAPGANGGQGALWVAVNERDELGSDLVPDYMTSVKDGGFYGFPYSYYGQHVDTRMKPQRPEMVAKALVPDYALGPHTASLGLTAMPASTTLPSSFAGGMIVGQHGSWNRNPRSGYKVIYVPFSGDKPSGPPVDVLTGFLSPGGEAWGRPVGVTFDKPGDLLVADDVGNTIWRVAGTRSNATTATTTAMTTSTTTSNVGR